MIYTREFYCKCGSIDTDINKYIQEKEKSIGYKFDVVDIKYQMNVSVSYTHHRYALLIYKLTPIN